MAVAFRSQANSGWVTASSFTVTKPSGLTVGDLMILFYVGNTPNPSPPTGWTAFPGFISNSGSALPTWMYYKYADSSDVAASDFTITLDSSGKAFGTIIAMSNPTNLASLLVKSTSSTTNTATPSITGLTPDTRGNSLLLQFWHGASNISSIATYAIATSDPTWTEIFDVADGTTYCISAAWALRPETTATGNFSSAGGNATTDWTAALVSIAPGWVTSTSENIEVSEDVDVTVTSSFTESVELSDGVSSSESRVWTPVNKPSSSTWTPLTK